MNETLFTKPVGFYDNLLRYFRAYSDGAGGGTLEIGQIGSLTSVLKVDTIQPMNFNPIGMFGSFNPFVGGGLYFGVFEPNIEGWMQRYDTAVGGWFTMDPNTAQMEPYQLLNGIKLWYDPQTSPFVYVEPNNDWAFPSTILNARYWQTIILDTLSGGSIDIGSASATGSVTAWADYLLCHADIALLLQSDIVEVKNGAGSIAIKTDALANVGVGTTTPGAKLDLETVTTGDGARVSAFGGASSGEPVLALRAARGTQGGGATAVLSNDPLGVLAFMGYGSAGQFGVAAAKIQAYAHGNFSDTSKPTSLRFYTTPPLSVTPVERGRFTHDGEFRVGITGQFTVNSLGAITSLQGIGMSSVAALTNGVTAGGTNDVVADFTDLTLYANDAATIRNDIYQLARKLAEVVTALRAYGLLL